MKVDKCTFDTDVRGFYITPMFCWSKTEKYGNALWLGFGPWLIMVSFK